MNKNIFKEDTTKITQLVNRIIQYKKTGIALAAITISLFMGGLLIAFMLQGLKLYENMTSEEMKTWVFYICFCFYSSLGIVFIVSVLGAIFNNRFFVGNQEKVDLYELIKNNKNVLELTKTLYKNQKFLTVRQLKNIKNYYHKQKIEDDIKKIDQCVFG